jgi:nitrogenase molybdenum-iron protein NifN
MNASVRDEVPKSPRKDGAVNPCTVCAPLGAAVASAGIARAVPLLPGAQGCATYIRRYLISHFREPVDIASSSFGETQTVFGGEDNLARALDNIERQYAPELVTVATTCLAETIGEDLPLILHRYAASRKRALRVVHASTPSYKDGHIEGFHAMVRAVVEQLVEAAPERKRAANVLGPMVSPADLRHLKEVVSAFGLEPILLPDYSTTLDGVILDEYRRLPEGGTELDAIRTMGAALTTLDLTLTGRARRASSTLDQLGATAKLLGLPIGVRATDAVVDHLQAVAGQPPPEWLTLERGRLLDAYADGHKYVFGKRAAIFGDPEFVAAIAHFLGEIGMRPALCATGARNRALRPALEGVAGIEEILDDADFASIETCSKHLELDLLIGSSKGYRTARELGVPLIRVGFPIHDRFGAGRLLHVGYRGTMRLFDELVNTFIEERQQGSSVGFSYL